MSDRTLHVLRLIVAVLVVLGAALAAVADAPPWATTVLAVVGSLVALVTRLEVILGADINGDGKIGEGGNRSRPAPRPGVRDVSIVLIAGALIGCGGQAVELPPNIGAGFEAMSVSGEGCIAGEAEWYDGVWHGDLSVTGDIEIGARQYVELWGLRIPVQQLILGAGAAGAGGGTAGSLLACVEVAGQRWCPVDASREHVPTITFGVDPDGVPSITIGD